MKKTIIKGCVFAATFIVVLLMSSLFLNKGNTDMTAEMKLPELPLVYINMGGEHVNMMHGFLSPMEEKYMKESIMPIGPDRKLSISVKKYDQTVDSMAFEVRSVDGSRLVENTEITNFRMDGENITADIVLKDLIDEKTEYSLTFLLNLEDGRCARYYTRIIQADGYGVKEKLAFVRDFSAATFHEDWPSGFEGNLEPNSEGDNSTLSKVNIHSSASQIGWAGLTVEQLTEPVFTIRDITEQTASVTVEYIVSYMRQEKETFAVVDEVYRVRQGTDGTMYLLDFERRMSDIFSEDKSAFVGDKIALGITDPNVEMMESDGGKILAFAQAGVLYSLNMTDNKLSKLFSFYDPNGKDERSFYGGHEFKILQVDEEGNVFFMVYGYISRGRREGYTGAEVYLYNNSLNTVEELAFIPTLKAPEIFKAEVEQLAYVNGKNELYMLLDSQFICIHLDRQTVEVVAENLNGDSYQVSESNRMIVWPDQGKKYESTSLTLMNLNSTEQVTIDAGSGNYIMALGFMNEDLVYGMARISDVSLDDTGKMVFPMYQIKIQDENGKVLKTYEKAGVYVTGCSMNENQIILDRVEKDGEGNFVPCENDQIVSGVVDVQRSNKIITIPLEEYKNITEIQMKSDLDGKKLKFLTPKEVLYEGSREIQIPQSQIAEESYYVYSPGGEVTIMSAAGEAINLANDIAGTVMGESGAYIWRRGRLNVKNQIMAIEGVPVTEEKNSLAVCLDSLFSYEGIMRNSEYLLAQGKTVQEVLEENLDGMQVLDLSGCSLESVLYYPDREIPVLAILGDGNAVLIIGFNEKNVVLMNPEMGSVYKMGMNEAAQWFEETGCHFLSYVKK